MFTIYAANCAMILFRLNKTLGEATSKSIIILNEVFNSTSLSDAIFLSTKVLTRSHRARRDLRLRHLHRRIGDAQRDVGQHGEHGQTG